MKRVQLILTHELDDRLERIARKQGRSKSDLAREILGNGTKPLPPIEEDPIWQLVGAFDFEPVEDIDEFLYG